MKVALAGAFIVIGFTAIGLVVSGKGDRLATAWTYLFAPAPKPGTGTVVPATTTAGLLSGVPDTTHLPGGFA